MSKIGRRYKLTIEIESDETQIKAIEVKYPLTLEFEVIRNTGSSLNSGSFRIYNLSEKNRNIIFQNRIDANNVIGKRRKVILQAGYGDVDDKELTVIFIGNLLEAYSYRQGADIITYINALDGSLPIYNTIISQTLQSDLSFRGIIDILLSGLKGNGLQIGKVGEIQGTSSTSTTLFGNNFYLLQENLESQVFVDLEKINILKQNEYITTTGGRVLLINSQAGLLGTPQRQGSNVVIDIVFEPRIIVAQLIEIQATINKQFDGQYKVMGLSHKGIISGAVAGDLTTSLQLFIGDELIGDLKGL